MDVNRRSLFKFLASVTFLSLIAAYPKQEKAEAFAALPPIIIDGEAGYLAGEPWLDWLRRRGVDPNDTYLVEIYPEALFIRVYQFERWNGKFFIEGNDVARRQPFDKLMVESDPLPDKIAAKPRAWKY